MTDSLAVDRSYSRALVALLLGFISVLGFAPYSMPLLPPLALALLLLLWRRLTPARALLEGWCYGLGLMGGGVYWMYISISQFGGVSLPLALLASLLLIMVLAAYFALIGWLYARLSAGMAEPAALLLLFPLLWGLVEWLRGWLFTGFPWLSLGYSQIESPLAGYAPLLGVLGLGWCTALLAGAVALLWRRDSALPALLLIGLIYLGGSLLGRVSWTQPSGPPIEVALVQGNIEQARKWLPEEIGHSLRLYLELTLPQLGKDLVIWPETAVPAFAHTVDEILLVPLEERALASGTELLLGLPIASADGQAYYNAMLALGQPRQAYHKRHLVPFGEFMPLPALLGPVFSWLRIPMSAFSPGAPDQPLLTLAGHPVGISICYEDAFGDEIIPTAADAAFLVNVSNDAWFGDSSAPHQHLEIARMRALETGRWLLRSTNTGISAIITPGGRLSQRSPQFQSHVLTGQILPYQGSTPYVRLGNRPLFALWLGLALLLIIPRWRRLM